MRLRKEERLCFLFVTRNVLPARRQGSGWMSTDWTAQRMMGYLSHYKKLPMAEIVDEMLAILSDRNRIMKKHELEDTNAKWNEFLNRRFGEDN